MDLGFNRDRTWYKVISPLILPGVITGFTMVFMPVVTNFVISRLLGDYDEVYGKAWIKVLEGN